MIIEHRREEFRCHGKETQKLMVRHLEEHRARSSRFLPKGIELLRRHPAAAALRFCSLLTARTLHTHPLRSTEHRLHLRSRSQALSENFDFQPPACSQLILAKCPRCCRGGPDFKGPLILRVGSHPGRLTRSHRPWKKIRRSFFFRPRGAFHRLGAAHRGSIKGLSTVIFTFRTP